MTNHGKGGPSPVPMIGQGGAYSPNFSKAAGETYAGTLDLPLAELGGYKPLHDIVIVQFKQAPEKSDGGVLLVDTAQRRPEEGIVVAAGPGNITYNGNHVPVDVKRGDRVRFQPQAFGNAINHPDKAFPGVDPKVRLLEMRETDILGVWPA